MEMENAIIETSFKLFHRYGIKSVTMDDLSKEMGMSKKTLYKYFANKEALVKEVTKAQIQFNQNNCLQIANNAENAIHELILMMGSLRELFHDINPSLIFDLQKYHPKVWKIMEEHQNTFIQEMIVANLERGIKEGLYRKKLKLTILARLRMHELWLSFNPDSFPSDQFKMEEVQLELLEHFMFGISTIKGHELANQYKKQINE